MQVCEEMYKALHAAHLTGFGKFSLKAKKLDAPIIMNELEEEKTNGIDTGYIDPFLGIKKITSLNYNVAMDEAKFKMDQKKQRKEKKEQDALDKKIEEFKSHKLRIPKPTVNHDKNPLNHKDIVINNFTLTIGGKALLESTQLKLAKGRKYGLIGRNGIGKTTMLSEMVRKEILGFPKEIHVSLVEQEVEGRSITVLDSVLNCDKESADLLNELQEIDTLLTDPTQRETRKGELASIRLDDINKRLLDIEAGKAEGEASKILIGLGFTKEDLRKPTKDFSGGWKMRVALAQAIFSDPDLLLLDEPTNHLDIEAISWLENYLSKVKSTVVIVSHARDFLNNVVDEIILFRDLKLSYYRGNYDSFEKVRSEMIRRYKKAHDAQQHQIKHVQASIDKFRYNAKRASMVQSRIKMLDKLDIVDEISEDPTCIFILPQPDDTINPPLLQIDEGMIAYDPANIILKGVNFYIDMESRISIVGPNGAGKTTLLKALTGELPLLSGYYYRHNRLRLSLYTQHHVDKLDLRLSPIEQMQALFTGQTVETFRNYLGSFGISGSMGLRPMYLLSGGQKSRVALAVVTWRRPHILMMDEPTNHMDIDAVSALVIALNSFSGGIVVVSHDQYFVTSICKKIFVVKGQKVKEFVGDFKAYKSLYKKRTDA
jgi:ATP-binding cassette subfamily F protein 3